MITLGVDAHKKLHVATAVDETGRDLGSWRGPNTPAGWQDALTWASGLGVTRQWGIEGAWGYGRGLAQHLVATGEAVYEVNTRWTALGRRHARRPGKTDRLDARAVATFVSGEAPDLPRVGAEDVTVVLDLLTSEREALRSETRRLWNQIHALLLQLDPEYKSHLPSFESRSIFGVLAEYEAKSPSAVQQERAAAVRRLAQRLRLGEEQARDLGRQIKGAYCGGGIFGSHRDLRSRARRSWHARRDPGTRLPVPDRRGASSLCRSSSAGNVFRGSRAPPAESGWEPAAQLASVHDRAYSAPLLESGPGIHAAPLSRRKDETRGNSGT
jgi:transposase